jgi:hypothetical protein
VSSFGADPMRANSVTERCRRYRARKRARAVVLHHIEVPADVLATLEARGALRATGMAPAGAILEGFEGVKVGTDSQHTIHELIRGIFVST